MTKIYTKTGDRGTTGTYLGRMSKADRLTEALGAVDEVNSWAGLVRQGAKEAKINSELKRVQSNLMTIASGLAGSGLKIKPGEVKHLERLIDELTAKMPKLGRFIYPVGDLQVARAVCRRAERNVVEVATDREVLKYMNRLSDALFTLGRWVNYKTGVIEEKWEN